MLIGGDGATLPLGICEKWKDREVATDVEPTHEIRIDEIVAGGFRNESVADAQK